MRPSPPLGSPAGEWGAAEADDGLQSWAIVLQQQLCAVQTRHRSDEAQSKTGAGRIAAGFETHEALDHARAIRARNAGPRVGDDEIDALGRDGGPDRDVSAFRGVFDGIVDEVRERLADEAAIAFDHRGAGRFDFERDA